METLSPKGRFDALADVFGFDASDVGAIRRSINHLLQDVNELVRAVNEAMNTDGAPRVMGDLDEDGREKLQSLLASFIMRTINCNYDDDYCNYAVEISHTDDVPSSLFTTGLTLANDYAVRCLSAKVDDREELTAMLSAWNRLTAILKELTRP